MEQVLNDFLAIFTSAIVFNASFLELAWLILGLIAFRRHWMNKSLALGDRAAINEGLALNLIIEQDAIERLLVIYDRLITERVRCFKQAVFILIGIVACIAPAGTTPQGRVYAFILGAGLLTVQAALTYNSTLNARTRVKLNALLAERSASEPPIIRTTFEGDQDDA